VKGENSNAVLFQFVLFFVNIGTGAGSRVDVRYFYDSSYFTALSVPDLQHRLKKQCSSAKPRRHHGNKLLFLNQFLCCSSLFCLGYLWKDKSENGVRKILEEGGIPLEKLLVETGRSKI
jgi:hypothetical protein